MRRMLMLAVAAASVIALSTTSASAITGNYVKDFQHPFVGLAVFYDQDGQFVHRCSGSLLTPTVFLTAGHCVFGVDSARVYFEQDAGAHYDPATEHDPVSGYPDNCASGTEDVCTTGSTLLSYGYDEFQTFPNTHDAGVVLLDNPIALSEYGALATAGSLDRLATRRGQQDITFTSSGYGLSRTNPTGDVSFRIRLMAEKKLNNLRSHLTSGYNLQTSANPGHGRGGECFGDSGGPIFYGPYSSNTIVGVVSFGLNNNCRGNDFEYRTDQQDFIDWLLASVPRSQARQIQFVSI